ncbi:MAG: hypothetical protein WKF70_00985 [Chitinophagaceae bacterium]
MNVASTSLVKHLDFAWILRFCLFFTGLYYFNIAYIGIVDPRNFYVSFFDVHLNYISWFSSSIVAVSNFIAQGFGVNAHVTDGYKLMVDEHTSVTLSYTCAGFGIVSFWLGFINAHGLTVKQRIAWSVAGMFAIWFINCWRVGLLLVALHNNWQVNSFISHHDLFNLVAYAIICLLIFFFYRKSAC